jgi:hypothetical protein
VIDIFIGSSFLFFTMNNTLTQQSTTMPAIQVVESHRYFRRPQYCRRYSCVFERDLGGIVHPLVGDEIPWQHISVMNVWVIGIPSCSWHLR